MIECKKTMQTNLNFKVLKIQKNIYIQMLEGGREREREREDVEIKSNN